MATNQVLIKEASASAVAQISFATHGNYAPAAANTIELGSPTTTLVELEMALLNLGDNAARQSAKADLGVVRAARYLVTVCIEYQLASPTTGTPVRLYWGASGQSTPLNGNPGYLTGSDAVYDGGPATLEEGLFQLQPIGVLIVSADQEFQIADVGIFSPTHRYGSLVVVNRTGVVICDTDSNDSAVVLTPIVDDIAAAA